MGKKNGRPRTFYCKKFGRNLFIAASNSVVVVRPHEGSGMRRQYPHLIGKAKCNPGDEFNLKIGIRLAALRMLASYFKQEANYHIRRLCAYEQEIKDVMEGINVRCVVNDATRMVINESKKPEEKSANKKL